MPLQVARVKRQAARNAPWPCRTISLPTSFLWFTSGLLCSSLADSPLSCSATQWAGGGDRVGAGADARTFLSSNKPQDT